MYLQQIRNTTIFLYYGGNFFSVDELLKADAYIITHLHMDHFDEQDRRLLPKDAPIFIQNTSDQLLYPKRM